MKTILFFINGIEKLLRIIFVKHVEFILTTTGISMRYVFFEGIAGSGKSTTSQNISKTLNDKNVDHRLIREIDEDNPFVTTDAPCNGELFCERALRDWNQFIFKDNSFCILDNAFFQYPTNALVWIDYPRDKIKEHIRSVFKIVEKGNPHLIYFHGDDVKSEVSRVLKLRGDAWIEKNRKSFVDSPFGKSYGENYTQGFYDFFEDVVQLYESLIEELPIKTLRINKSGLDWKRYESEILDFIQ